MRHFIGVQVFFNLPVDDPVSVKVLQGEHDLGGVEPGPGLVELSRALNLEHQVTAVDVFHDEEKALLEKQGTNG